MSGDLSRQKAPSNRHPNSLATGPFPELRPLSPVDWEVPRKVLHSTPGFVTLAIYFCRPRSLNGIIATLWTALVIVVSADFWRFYSEDFAKVYVRFLGSLMRESEKAGMAKLNGVVWYLIGVIAVLSAYPRDVAVVSILILSWADTAASTIGRLYGPKTSKLPRGSALAVGFFVSVVFWGTCTYGMGRGVEESWWQWGQTHNGGWGGLIMLGFGVGLISSLVEALNLGSLDDNLTLPILGGAAIWVWLMLLRHCTVAIF
ncbi:uncharacterized protein EI90DRAFT_3282393 [Cantharellus anzutake]|uniref:uncharacterized protein n=1 Tax=Cantharellus anzutake TaxID=1750568 RepID=UPI0019089887|nr:uncharacterized protein EI90DRAFT_3282393 [Cantharellus anzutake]KAF8319149.1 hypothetical protein EI90DRAFT_3282393 [Cantharellus anzutake]